MKLSDYLYSYENTSKHNNEIHKNFTEKANEFDYLKTHRDFVENHKYGFGDRAFHYMWLLLFQNLNKTGNDKIKALEIGVFKGQVISLWSLIGKKEGINLKVSAVSPFKGNLGINNSLLKRVLLKAIPALAKKSKTGDLYDKDDYLSLNAAIFKKFDLDFNSVNKHIGFSNEEKILDALLDEKFDLIYIDGDHSYNGVVSDIINFAPKVNRGGFLIMDDASCNIPGGDDGQYWKGHQAVSDACLTIEKYGFKNVLNVGHNRIYEKT